MSVIDQKEAAAVATALFLFTQGESTTQSNGSVQTGTCKFNPWAMKIHVMRPQPIKTTYMKPVKK